MRHIHLPVTRDICILLKLHSTSTIFAADTLGIPDYLLNSVVSPEQKNTISILSISKNECSGNRTSNFLCLLREGHV